MVMRILLLICLVLFGSAEQEKGKKKLIFLFEISRHGARAPLDPKYAEQFTVGPEQLTPSGMRQHYLLGAYYRKKYIDEMKFLKPYYEPDDMFVASTYFARTIESARARMFGLYPPSSSNNQLHKEDLNFTYPLIHISEDIALDSFNAIPSGYEPIAVMNNDGKHDTIFTTGNCPYLERQYAGRHADLHLWQPFDDYFRPRVFKKMSQVMDVPYDKINYQSAYYYGDALISMEFEGVVSRDIFSDEEWLDVFRLQTPWILYSFSALGIRIMASKIFNPVLSLFNHRLGREFNKKLISPYKGTEKYVYYSAHDTTIGHILEFLLPEDFSLEYVEYAYNIIFEFYEHEEYETPEQR